MFSSTRIEFVHSKEAWKSLEPEFTPSKIQTNLNSWKNVFFRTATKIKILFSCVQDRYTFELVIQRPQSLETVESYVENKYR